MGNLESSELPTEATSLSPYEQAAKDLISINGRTETAVSGIVQWSITTGSLLENEKNSIGMDLFDREKDRRWRNYVHIQEIEKIALQVEKLEWEKRLKQIQRNTPFESLRGMFTNGDPLVDGSPF